jgi:hypothetical protein
MIKVAYLKSGECYGCNRKGCLLIRAQGENSNQAFSFKLCIDCLRGANDKGYHAWPADREGE